MPARPQHRLRRGRGQRLLSHRSVPGDRRPPTRDGHGQRATQRRQQTTRGRLGGGGEGQEERRRRGAAGRQFNSVKITWEILWVIFQAKF